MMERDRENKSVMERGRDSDRESEGEQVSDGER